MAIGGAFLGGGVEVVPAGSCKLELEILTEDRANLTATFTIQGTSTYTVTAGADGRAVYTVPAGQTYTVSVNITGYDNIASQTVIAESGTVRYVRFEAFAGRVKRSGDTMTGVLTITSTSGTPRMYLRHPSLDITTTPSTNCFLDQEYLDKNGKRFALIEGLASGNGSTRQIGLMINSSTESGSDVWSRLQLTHTGTTAYATTPSWSVGTNDNSDKILTIKMANSLPSLVHTVGNESISGVKTFTSRIVEQKSSDMGMEMLSTSFDRGATFTSYQRPVQFIARDKNGDSVLLLQTYAESNNRRGLDLMLYDMGGKHCELSLKSDGSKTYASAPTTPSDATSNEIATADWSLSKFQRKITYGTGDPPSDGQAGDIYIKI